MNAITFGRAAALSTAIMFVTAGAWADHTFDGDMHWLDDAIAMNLQHSSGQPVRVSGSPGRVPAARTIHITDKTRHIRVTRYETVALVYGDNTTLWTFDTLGTRSFPLSEVIPGRGGITVYVDESPLYMN